MHDARSRLAGTKSFVGSVGSWFWDPCHISDFPKLAMNGVSFQAPQNLLMEPSVCKARRQRGIKGLSQGRMTADGIDGSRFMVYKYGLLLNAYLQHSGRLVKPIWTPSSECFLIKRCTSSMINSHVA